MQMIYISDGDARHTGVGTAMHTDQFRDQGRAVFGALPGSAIFIPLFQHKDHAAQHALAYHNRGTPKGGLSWLK